MPDHPVAAVEDGEEFSHVEPGGTRDRAGGGVRGVGPGEKPLALRQGLKGADLVLKEVGPVVPALLPVEGSGFGALYLGASLTQQVGGGLDDSGGIGRNTDQRIAVENRDAQVLRFEDRRGTERHRCCLGLVAVGAGDDPERRFEISDRACQGPKDTHVADRPRLPRQVGDVPAAGNPPFAGLQGKDAVVMRGIAHRAADVAADFQRRQARRHRNAAAASRATGRALRIPGVLGRPEQRAVGLKIHAELRHIGLAQDDGAGRPQPRHQACIRLGLVVLERRMARGGGEARHVEGLLDRDRHAVQRPEPGPLLAAALGTALGKGAVRRPRGLHRAGPIDDHQSIDGAIDPSDPLQVRLGRLD